MDKVHGDAGVKPPTINRPYIRKETINTVQRERVKNSYRQNIENISEEEQEDEMEMGM